MNEIILWEKLAVIGMLPEAIIISLLGSKFRTTRALDHNSTDEVHTWIPKRTQDNIGIKVSQRTDCSNLSNWNPKLQSFQLEFSHRLPPPPRTYNLFSLPGSFVVVTSTTGFFLSSAPRMSGRTDRSEYSTFLIKPVLFWKAILLNSYFP